jgi:hypothetical protein
MDLCNSFCEPAKWWILLTKTCNNYGPVLPPNSRHTRNWGLSGTYPQPVFKGHWPVFQKKFSAAGICRARYIRLYPKDPSGGVVSEEAGIVIRQKLRTRLHTQVIVAVETPSHGGSLKVAAGNSWHVFWYLADHPIWRWPGSTLAV